jgi:predicted secreted hydrolase
VSVPRSALELELEPLLADQEMDLSVRYWEGAVRVRGRRAGVPVDGYGYMELTGYGERPAIAR